MVSKVRYYLFLIITGLSIGGLLAIQGRLQEEPETLEPVKPDEGMVEHVDTKEEKPTVPVKVIKQPVPKKTKQDPPKFDCESADFDLEKTLLKMVHHIEAQKILYNSRPLSDCSGIFLRICQEFAKNCPNAAFPAPKEARDGRKLAQWYHDRDRLTLIQDASSSSEWIKPGAIMFYGHRNKDYKTITIQHITAASGIEHIGIVTAVERNEKGTITNYTLFHGRSTGKIASQTTHHHLKPSRKGIPAYGNWNQQWVAVANIVE